MSAHNRSIFNDGFFHFIISRENPEGFESEPEYIIHESLVRRVSRPLTSLMAPRGSKSYVHLDYVDDRTFRRFAEWLYTSDYSSAPPTALSTLEAVQEVVNEQTESLPDPQDNVVQVMEQTSPPSPNGDSTPQSGAGSKKNKKKSKTKKAISLPLPRLKDNEMSDQATIIGPFEIERHSNLNQGPNYEYLDHFLSHARLYVFAKREEVKDLTELTATRLSNALGQFQYYSERAEDIVALIDYVYNHSEEQDESRDKLRTAVLLNVAEHLEDLAITYHFGDLLQSGGQFVRDLACKTADRLLRLRRHIEVASTSPSNP